MNLDLDRSSWRRVKFGDVVRNVNENVKDPEAAGIDRVIGLEHLDPGELRIDRWGDPTEETTFTRRVKPGQTIFGKRRAYQRKTAYAEFDAVCSGDILVFESGDPGVLLPELLPFIAMTDGFYAKALETSAGSLSPRTRWSDLATYEFDLPPLADQRRIADLLWAMEAHERALLQELAHVEGASWHDPHSVRLALLDHLLSEGGKDWPSAPLGQVGTFTRGRRFTQQDYVDDGIGSIHYAEIHTKYDFAIAQVDKFVRPELKSSLRYAKPGNLVIAATSETAAEVCKATAWLGEDEVAVHDDCFILDHSLDAKFAALLFSSRDFQLQKSRFVSESKVARVSVDNLAKIMVPVPPAEVQRRIVASVSLVDAAIRTIREEASELNAAQRSLLNGLLGGQA